MNMSNITIEKTKYDVSTFQAKQWHHHQPRQQQPQQQQHHSSGNTSALATPTVASAAAVAQQPELSLKKTGIQLGNKVDVMYYSRNVRNDASLVPPIRQTASIFKQPVTVYKTQESKVKTDLKHGVQEKPKQLIWEKRLEGLKACDLDGVQFEGMVLPKGLRPFGPNVAEETMIQSVATALHVSGQPVTGQTGNRHMLEKNPGAFLDPKQPLVQACNVAEDDIKQQEERVTAARRRLQEALAQ